MKDCVFCQIVLGEMPCHKVWEAANHLAFLSIFPNTEGFTVVIPKKHYSSYVFEVPDKVINKLLSATKMVAKLLDKNLKDVGRTALMFEGFGVDHLHAKLFPMHGTKMKDWKLIASPGDLKYFDKYEGYISSHDHKRADDKKLAALVKRIRSK